MNAVSALIHSQQPCLTTATTLTSIGITATYYLIPQTGECPACSKALVDIFQKALVSNLGQYASTADVACEYTLPPASRRLMAEGQSATGEGQGKAEGSQGQGASGRAGVEDKRREEQGETQRQRPRGGAPFLPDAVEGEQQGLGGEMSEEGDELTTLTTGVEGVEGLKDELQLVGSSDGQQWRLKRRLQQVQQQQPCNASLKVHFWLSPPVDWAGFVQNITTTSIPSPTGGYGHLERGGSMAVRVLGARGVPQPA